MKNRKLLARRSTLVSRFACEPERRAAIPAADSGSQANRLTNVRRYSHGGNSVAARATDSIAIAATAEP
jgi:hypothetical protein